MSLYRWICVEFWRRKKKDIERNEKKVMTRKQLHIVCLSFHCVFLAPLNTFRDMCAAAFFKFIAWSTPVAMEISGLSVLVGAIGQTRKKHEKTLLQEPSHTNPQHPNILKWFVACAPKITNHRRAPLKCAYPWARLIGLSQTAASTYSNRLMSVKTWNNISRDAR